MDKETKRILLNRLIEVKAQRKNLRDFFKLLMERKSEIDMNTIDKILDLENTLQRNQETIEKMLND